MRNFRRIQDEFKDVKVLLFYTSEPYTLITRNKPVKSIEDIKGMKIRMTGGPPTDMMKLLGGVPMLIPMPDSYISLQKGVIDGNGRPVGSHQCVAVLRSGQLLHRSALSGRLFLYFHEQGQMGIACPRMSRTPS